MAHVRKLGPDRWQARYRGTDGRERAKNFRRERDATSWLTDQEGRKLNGGWTDPKAGRMRLDDAAESWLGSVRPTLKPKTVAAYESLLRSRILPALGACRLAELRPSDVKGWIAGMEAAHLSPSRIRQAHVVLSSILEEAVRDERIARNVARGARLPRMQRREAPYFEPRDVDRIIASMPAKYQPFIALQGVLGLRFGEAAALRRSSVNLLRRRLRVAESLAEIGGALIFGSTKTHAERSLPLPPSLLELLRIHLDENVSPDPDALLFTSPEGSPVRYSNFRREVWRPTLERLGLPLVGLHVLRHSGAARMIGAGWSAKAVQQSLGHGSVAFSLTVYGHLFDDDLDALAGALDGSFGTRPADSLRTVQS
jgi:integrase